jgi:hypothetical protein
MLLLHTKLLGTSSIVAIALLGICIYHWIRAIPIGSGVHILHMILGLLFASAAVLGGSSGGASNVPPLHVLYSSIWIVVWLFLWKGVRRFIPHSDQPRFWAVTTILLLILLHRIDATGQ